MNFINFLTFESKLYKYTLQSNFGVDIMRETSLLLLLGVLFIMGCAAPDLSYYGVHHVSPVEQAIYDNYDCRRLSKEYHRHLALRQRSYENASRHYKALQFAESSVAATQFHLSAYEVAVSNGIIEYIEIVATEKKC